MDFFIRFIVEMSSNGSAFFSSIIIIYFIIALIGVRSKHPRFGSQAWRLVFLQRLGFWGHSLAILRLTRL